MKNHKNIFIACIVLIASTLACNLQNVNPQASAPEIQTAAALTVQAILTPSITATIQQQAEAVSATSTPAGTASSNTITPTYSVPMLTLRASAANAVSGATAVRAIHQIAMTTTSKLGSAHHSIKRT